MTNTKLRLSVIGAGFWGRKLIGEYLSLQRKSDNVQLTRIVDSDKERLAVLAKEFDLPRDMLETDVSRVLSDSCVDAVHVATPNDTHYTIGMAALNAKKHVLVEKPMALTMREAVKLARKAEEESLVLNVGHIFRFNNAVKMTRSILDAGTIGDPLTFRLTWETLFNPLPRDRDIIFDLCPHPIDILNFVSGEWPTRVRAVGRSFSRKEQGREEVAESLAELNGDAFATIHVSWLYTGPKRRVLEITGSKSCLEVDTLNQRIMIYSREGSKECPVEVNNTIESMITHFVKNIREGGSQENSAMVGAMTVGVLHAMRRSMTTGRFVDVMGG